MGLEGGGVYIIQNIGDGLRVNVAGSKLDDGTNILSWPGGSGVGGNESWVAVPSGNNWKFRTQINGNKGQLLDEAVSSHQSCLWPDHDGSNQQWIVEPVAYYIKNLASGRVLMAGAKGNCITLVPEPGAEDTNAIWHFKSV